MTRPVIDPRIRAYAWTTREDVYVMNMNFLVVGRYFVMGSEFDSDDHPMTWLTRSFDDEAAAHHFAVMATQNVEIGGDVLTFGPVSHLVPESVMDLLGPMVNEDQASTILTVLFDTMKLKGVPA